MRAPITPREDALAHVARALDRRGRRTLFPATTDRLPHETHGSPAYKRYGHWPIGASPSAPVDPRLLNEYPASLPYASTVRPD
jgi:hypothetical protein